MLIPTCQSTIIIYPWYITVAYPIHPGPELIHDQHLMITMRLKAFLRGSTPLLTTVSVAAPPSPV